MLPMYHLAALHTIIRQANNHKPQACSPGTARLDVTCIMPQLWHRVGTLLGPFQLQWSVISPSFFSTSLALVRYFPAVCSLVSPICHSPPGRSGRPTQSRVRLSLSDELLIFQGFCLRHWGSGTSVSPHTAKSCILLQSKPRCFIIKRSKQLLSSWLQSSTVLARKTAYLTLLVGSAQSSIVKNSFKNTFGIILACFCLVQENPHSFSLWPHLISSLWQYLLYGSY